MGPNQTIYYVPKDAHESFQGKGLQLRLKDGIQVTLCLLGPVETNKTLYSTRMHVCLGLHTLSNFKIVVVFGFVHIWKHSRIQHISIAMLQMRCLILADCCCDQNQAFSQVKRHFLVLQGHTLLSSFKQHSTLISVGSCA